MVAIARALMVNPSLLLLDEPMEGLAPIIVQELMGMIRDLIRSSGMAVIVVEQHARLALSLTRHAIVLDRGRVVHASDSESLLARARDARSPCRGILTRAQPTAMHTPFRHGTGEPATHEDARRDRRRRSRRPAPLASAAPAGHRVRGAREPHARGDRRHDPRGRARAGHGGPADRVGRWASG